MALTALTPSTLDDLDRRALFELDCDSTVSIAALGHKCKVSRDRIAYRIQALEADGTIERYTIGVNPYRAGQTLFKTYFVLEKNPQIISQVISFLKKQPGVFWVAEVEGRWDLLYAAYANNAFEFSSLQDVVIAQFAKYIISFEVYVVVEAIFFRKKYLTFGPLKDNQIGEFRIGGEPANLDIDTIDAKILSLLSTNSRIPTTSLAEKIDLSPTATAYRVARLERDKIIVAYKIDLNPSRTLYQSFKAQYYLKSHQMNDSLYQFCKTHPNIVCLIHQLGECKVELEIDAQDFNHYQDILNELRAKFSGTVNTVNFKSQFYIWQPLGIKHR